MLLRKRGYWPLDRIFSALADPTRRAILRRLANGARSVTELAAPFDISLPAISKHLRVLEKAGLLVQKKDGRIHHCRIVTGPLRDAAQWIARYQRFWEKRLDSLEKVSARDKRREEIKRKSFTEKKTFGGLAFLLSCKN